MTRDTRVMMKVGIWGSYSYGNYGDELMALIFAMHLKRVGARPVVFGLHGPLARAYSIDSTRAVDELVGKAAFCLFGGGSLLSKKVGQEGEYAEYKRREYIELRKALESHECPLYFSSIGGDGQFGGDIDVTDYREELLRSRVCRSATVRQQVDAVKIEAQYGIAARFFPDVLLSVADFWEMAGRREEREELHVGLNLPRSYGQASRLLTIVGAMGRRVVYHYIGTVRPNSATNRAAYELMPCKESSRERCHPYDDPAETLRVLRSLDLIVTTKLHIGLTAVALGTPYVCVGRSLKSKAFLESIDAGAAYWGDLPEVVRKIRLFRGALSTKRIRAVRGWFDRGTVEAQKRQSRGHLSILQVLCEQHSREARQPA